MSDNLSQQQPQSAMNSQYSQQQLPPQQQRQPTGLTPQQQQQMRGPPGTQGMMGGVPSNMHPGGMPPGGQIPPPNMMNPSGQQMRMPQNMPPGGPMVGGGAYPPPLQTHGQGGGPPPQSVRQGGQMPMNSHLPPNMRPSSDRIPPGGPSGGGPMGGQPDQYNAEMQRSQSIQYKQNIARFIKDEVVNFSYTQLPPQLEELYNIQHSAVYKAIYNQSAFGGKRMQKVEEPQVMAIHYDFLLSEMQNMALEFQEESLYKKVLNVKLAREAQSTVLVKKELDRQKQMREEEERKKAQLLEEQEKAANYIQVPDNNQIKLEDMLDHQSLKVSLSGLLRVDSIVPPNNDNNLSSAFDDPFFTNQNQNNVMDLNNDNFDVFQSQGQIDVSDPNELIIDNIGAVNLNQPGDMLPDMPIPGLSNNVSMMDQQQLPQNSKQISNLPKLPIADVSYDIGQDFIVNNVIPKPEQNLLDYIDMFFKKEEHSINNNMIKSEFDEINTEIKPQQKQIQIPSQNIKTGFVRQDNYEVEQKTSVYFDREMEMEEASCIVDDIMDYKLSKFRDILVRDYNSREEEKTLREQQRDITSQLQRSEFNEQELLNVDNFIMDQQRQMQLQQHQSERQTLQQQLNKLNVQISQNKQLQVTQQINVKYKKKELKVYMPDDIFNQGLDSLDYSEVPTVQDEEELKQQIYQQQQQQSAQVTPIKSLIEQQQIKKEKKEKKKKIVRPENENPYSDDDMDFFNSVPDQSQGDFYNLFLKLFIEKQRKMALSTLEKVSNQQQYNSIKQKLVESDHLLQPEKLAKLALKQLQNKNNLNPQINYDNEQLRTILRNTPNKKALSFVEQAFMYWYVSIMGDEWKVIADVINFHPITKGGIRDSEELKNYFFFYSDTANLYYHVKIPIEPWRSTGMPMLINQRPPSLLNSVHQQCLIHMNNIKAYQKSIHANKCKYRVRINIDENGSIQLKPSEDQDMHYQEENKQQILGKRQHPNSSTNSLQQQQDNDLQDENNKNNQEEIQQINTSTSQNKQQLHGQSIISQNVQSQVVRSQFEIQAQINQEFQDNLNFIVNDTNRSINRDHSGAQISFYEYYDKLYKMNFGDANKRRKHEDEKSQLSLIDIHHHQRGPQNLVLLDKVDPNEANTPMMNALSMRQQGSDGFYHEYAYQKSIFYKSTMSYWIAYLLKKLYQQDKDMILRYKNQNQWEQQELQTKTVLNNRIHKQADECAKIQKAQLKGQTIPTSEELENQLRVRNITESIREYDIETQVAGVENLSDIWGGKTLWQYDSQQAIHQLNTESENTSDRPPDILKQTWDRKWETMDFYWFQKHKHLGPNEKKKDPSKKFSDHFTNQYSLSNMPPGTQYPPPGATGGGGLPPGPGLRPPGGSGKAGSPRAQTDPQSLPGSMPGVSTSMDTNAVGVSSGGASQLQIMPDNMPNNQNINLMRTQQQISQQQSMQRQQDMMRQQQQQQLQQQNQQNPSAIYPPSSGTIPPQQVGGVISSQARGSAGSGLVMPRSNAPAGQPNIQPFGNAGVPPNQMPPSGANQNYR